AAMDQDDWPALAAALAGVRRDVHAAFEQVFASPLAGAPERDSGEQRLLAFWEGQLDENESATLLARYGIDDAAAVAAAIADLRNRGRYRALLDRGQRWLLRLVPLLFAAAAQTDQPGQA